MENRAISRLFKLAKNHLATDEEWYVSTKTSRYICNALSCIQGVGEFELTTAKLIVKNRLEGFDFAEQWLISKGISKEDLTLKNTQVWSQQWLDQLIKEFDVSGKWKGIMTNKLTEFEQGVFYAAAMVQIISGRPGIAADVLRAATLQFKDCSELDDMDKDALRIVNQERGMALKGLGYQEKVITLKGLG